MTADQPDAVDRIAEQWARERPELDVGPMLVVGRIHRVAELLDQGLRPVFAQAELGNGDFDVLSSLRRAGAPYKLTPTELAGTGSQASLWDELPRIGVPTLVAAGADDTRYADIAERTAAAIGPHARTALVPGAGHAAHLERPDAFLAADLFNPRSIAILGASGERGRLAHRPLDYLRRMGYPGQVFQT